MEPPAKPGVLSQCSSISVVGPPGGELCSFLEQKLEAHHSRLLHEVEVLFAAGLGSLQQSSLAEVVTALPSSDGPSEEDAQQAELAMQGCQMQAERSMLSVASQLPATFIMRESYETSQVVKKRSAKSVQPTVHPHLPVSALSMRRREQFHRLITTWVNSPSYELTSCCIIMANAAFFGVEAEVTATFPEDETRRQVFWGVGQTFTIIFTLEILLRLFVDWRGFFCSSENWRWNMFDSAIVIVGLVEGVLSLAGMETSTNLTHVRIIRMARTVRVFKVVRLLSAFTSLRVLVNSVLSTLRSLVWTLVLLAIILYIFGLLFTNAALEHLRAQEGPELLHLHFGSLFRSIYTLFQAITSGVNWAQVAAPLSSVHPIWEGTFSVFIMFTFFAVLNVVTGVFCQSAIESANQDKDTLVQSQLAMQKVYTEQLQHLFKQIDGHSTGFITLSMFEESLQDDQVKAYFDGLDLTTDDAWNLFKLLDKNESNSIDLREFVAGCLRLRGRARSIDIHMLMYQSQWTMKRLGDVLEKMATMEATAAARAAFWARLRCSQNSSQKPAEDPSSKLSL